MPGPEQLPNPAPDLDPRAANIDPQADNVRIEAQRRQVEAAMGPALDTTFENNSNHVKPADALQGDSLTLYLPTDKAGEAPRLELAQQKGEDGSRTAYMSYHVGEKDNPTWDNHWKLTEGPDQASRLERCEKDPKTGELLPIKGLETSQANEDVAYWGGVWSENLANGVPEKPEPESGWLHRALGREDKATEGNQTSPEENTPTEEPKPETVAKEAGVVDKIGDLIGKPEVVRKIFHLGSNALRGAGLAKPGGEGEPLVLDPEAVDRAFENPLEAFINLIGHGTTASVNERLAGSGSGSKNSKDSSKATGQAEKGFLGSKFDTLSRFLGNPETQRALLAIGTSALEGAGFLEANKQGGKTISSTKIDEAVINPLGAAKNLAKHGARAAGHEFLRQAA